MIKWTSKKENEILLLIWKKTNTVSEQTKTIAKETLELKITKLMFSFYTNPPLYLEEQK